MQQTTFLAVHNDNNELHKDDVVQKEGEVYYQKVTKWKRTKQIQSETQQTQHYFFNDHKGKSKKHKFKKDFGVMLYPTVSV